jgi:carbon monoxide dehydrogenase subunit G
MPELDSTFENGKPTDYNWEAIRDLDRLIPCVEGGTVIERTGPESAKAQILVRMGAMSMKFVGTVSITEQDEANHTAVLAVKSREEGGQGYANANVTFTLNDGGGSIHTNAQITGKAASMGEGVMMSVIDALIKDFAEKLKSI